MLLAALEPGVDHVEVELVGVLVERLLLQPLDGALLPVEVPGALTVVLLLLQQPQVLPGRQLRGKFNSYVLGWVWGSHLDLATDQKFKTNCFRT